MINRMIGVLRLSPKTFEEIGYSDTAFNQAATIVASVALLSAFSNGFLARGVGAQFRTGYFLTTLAWTFISWYLWAALSYFVGTLLFGGKAGLSEMLRVIGFAFTPQVLVVVPCAGWLVGMLWSLVAGFIGARQALNLDNLPAALTILVGFALNVAGGLLLGFLVGKAFTFTGF
jgi:hypothetical protein